MPQISKQRGLSEVLVPREECCGMLMPQILNQDGFV